LKRSKSGLLPPAEAAKAKEPETGAGSATCACRVWYRRAMVEEARLALRGAAGGQIAGQDGPKFADIFIGDLGALDEFYEAARYKVEHGTQYRLRVAVVVA
jgi:hypothetical protein